MRLITFFLSKKNKYSEKDLINAALSFKADVVYMAGWFDKTYLKIAKRYKRLGISVIMGLDNPWRGNAKQKIGVYPLSFLLKNHVDYIWCPGVRQYEYARRLGFHNSNIRLGLYSADVESFSNVERNFRKYPKTIIYVGRFVEEKGVLELYESFRALQSETSTEWKLLMVGNGPLKENLKPVDGINIKGFVQPTELLEISKDIGAFCLPSWDEHWGVVVHEYAALGVPLLVSDQVNAGIPFVHHGYNGFKFKARDKKSLKKQLRNLIQLSDLELKIMGERSQKLSYQITPQIWANVIKEILN